MTAQIHISSTYIKTEKELQTVHLYFSFINKHICDQTGKEHRAFIEEKAKAYGFVGKDTEMLTIEFMKGTSIEHLTIVGMGKSDRLSEHLLRNRLGEVFRSFHSSKISTVVIHLDTCIEQKKYGIQSIAEGTILGSYVFDVFKGKEGKKDINHVKNVHIIISSKSLLPQAKEGLALAEKKARAVLLARDLVNMPASHVHPDTLVGQAREIEKLSKGSVTVDVLDKNTCEKLGMGAFLGVAEGSDRKPSFIVLKYKGKGSKKIALIGKSITFDSGGLSLKPSEAMVDMKIDMAGGATVLGVFAYLASEKPALSFEEIFGIIPACENMPSGKAIKPGDVVTAMNGKTIEVLNTDAEGRLTLADALVYAEKRLRVDYCIDMATLTGACMVALGNDLAGLFTNDEQFEKEYRPYAVLSGDEYCVLPLYEGYARHIKSNVADVKNIGTGRYGGAITAGLFLKEFVEKMKWMHIDIAGPAYREHEKGVFPKGASGWGVLSIINFLEKKATI